MADGTAAYLFSRIFRYLAETNTDRDREMAREMWGESRGYDFSYDDMGADDALITLGLARKGIDPRYPNDGETVLYAGEEGGPDV